MSYVDLTDIIKNQVPASERHTGYLVDLSSIEFAESDESTTSWVHALSIGSFKHPLWGTLDFSADRIRRFAQGVKDNVLGIDPAIDFQHTSDEAAGWVKDAEARSDGLWLFVEWTKNAVEKIRNKEFRYFSADFLDEWVDPSGKKHTDVLRGGGLTNRPFLKNLVPVNLSELFSNGTQKGKEDESMKLTEQLREALGLSEDSTEQDALDAIGALNTKLEEASKSKEDPPKEIPVELSENPIVKGLLDEVAELRTARTLSEAKQLTDSWATGKNGEKKFAIPPAATEPLTDLIVNNPKLSEKLTEAMDAILETGLVTLGERGTAHKQRRDGDEGDGTAIAELNSRVKKLMEENDSITFADAYSEVSRDEELFNRYRRESLAGVTSELPGGES